MKRITRTSETNSFYTAKYPALAPILNIVFLFFLILFKQNKKKEKREQELRAEGPVRKGLTIFFRQLHLNNLLKTEDTSTVFSISQVYTVKKHVKVIQLDK